MRILYTGRWACCLLLSRRARLGGKANAISCAPFVSALPSLDRAAGNRVCGACAASKKNTSQQGAAIRLEFMQTKPT